MASGAAEKPSDPIGLVGLSAVLETVRANLTCATEDSGAEILAASLPDVGARQTELVQVLQNLIANPTKYSRQAPQIEISARLQGMEYVFSVRDNGIGIAPEHFQQIFKVFRRLHRGEYPGTGIGLAICARIVKNNGGRIWVESKLGEGSTFHFTWPAI